MGHVSTAALAREWIATHYPEMAPKEMTIGEIWQRQYAEEILRLVRQKYGREPTKLEMSEFWQNYPELVTPAKGKPYARKYVQR